MSGLLAAAWRPALDPRLIVAIAMHDTPWRAIDAVARRRADGTIVDFVSYPIEERLAFYATGITELEAVDAYVATMVSLHYSSFAGVAGIESFVSAEQARRERLAPLIGTRVERIADDLRWLQFFDVLSLHVCLTGPDVPDEHLPPWLRNVSGWAKGADGRPFDLAWLDASTLSFSPHPFDGPLKFEIESHTRDGRTARQITIVPTR